MLQGMIWIKLFQQLCCCLNLQFEIWLHLVNEICYVSKFGPSPLINNVLYFCVLPGQAVVHTLRCSESPGQGLPLFKGGGLLHRRVRFLVPFPQELLQEFHWLHVDHSPFTVKIYPQKLNDN